MKVFSYEDDCHVELDSGESLWAEASQFVPHNDEVVSCMLESGEGFLGKHDYDNDLSEDVWDMCSSAPYYLPEENKWVCDEFIGVSCDVILWTPLPKPATWTQEQIDDAVSRGESMFEGMNDET